MFDDYQLKTLTTLKTPISQYTLQGIVDEFGEVVEKIYADNTKLDLIKEVGDVMYYCAASCHLMGYKFSEVYRPVTSEHLQVFTLNQILTQGLLTGTKIIGLNKRELRGDLTAAQKGDILGYIADITSDLDYIIKRFKLGTLEEIFAINITKLAQRKLNDTLLGKGDNR